MPSVALQSVKIFCYVGYLMSNVMRLRVGILNAIMPSVILQNVLALFFQHRWTHHRSWRHDIQHNDTQYNGNVVMLSVSYAECH